MNKPTEIIEFEKGNIPIVMRSLKLDRFPELQKSAVDLMKRVLDGDEQLSQTQAFVIGHLLKEIE